jgi:FtsP/CotA-like multicopper oxidase with cupredoxin domain
MALASRLSRRDALKLGVLGSASLLLPLERRAFTASGPQGTRIAASKLPKPFTRPFAVPPVLQPIKRDETTDYYQLWQMEKPVEIIPGLQTPIYGYNGITPGPTIVAQRGRPAVVQQINSLPSQHRTLGYKPWTSTHLHGSASLPEYDGYASDVTQPGQWKNYHYPNIQDARTLWYHDHGVHHTAENAYMGLAAMYILHDEAEQSLGLPRGAYDVPLILKDAMFATDGSLLFDNHSESGLYGDVNLVNGVPWPLMKVERRKYRFRVLNACISRSFRLKLSTGEPITIIGTDGGLMPAPQDVANFRIGMAERYEIVIDFSKYAIGERVVLQNNSPPNNIDDVNTPKVMAFDVVAEPTSLDGNSVPSELNTNQEVMGLTAANSVKRREMMFQRDPVDPTKPLGPGQWTIDGTTWEKVIESNYEYVLANPGYDDVEVWRLTNRSGGWFHPVHIHLVDFKVLSRNGGKPFAWEKGPKDVVYVGENESVDVVMRFTNQRGKYMIHCHNLVHEDHDMMGQFQVGPSSSEHHPVYADPARDLPAPAL